MAFKEVGEMFGWKTILAFLVASALTPHAKEDIRELDLTFNNGNVEIAGTVLLPAAEGPHPGMVLIGGSGPSDRSSLIEMAEGFAREGVAVLVYDKRGTGKSGGNWMSSSLHDLAADATAAFRALAALNSIDPARIGYWGISQGGWVVPLASAGTPVAFAIVISGGGVAPREIETRNYLSIVGRTDDSPRARSEMQQILDDYFAYLGGEGRRTTLLNTLDEYRNRPWFAATGIEKVIPGEAKRDHWAWVANFDPGPSIAAMRAPVLVLLGDADPLTPAEATARAWRNALPDECSNCSVTRVPGAGHGLRSGLHGGPLVPEFHALQLEWLSGLGIL